MNMDAIHVNMRVGLDAPIPTLPGQAYCPDAHPTSIPLPPLITNGNGMAKPIMNNR